MELSRCPSLNASPLRISKEVMGRIPMVFILFSDPPQKSQEGGTAFLSNLDRLKILRNFRYFKARFKLKGEAVFHFGIGRLSPPVVLGWRPGSRTGEKYFAT